ncbi:MAG: CBS domain-containing protein [bacterium]|nr:CBS domain-containing protein [bacterium]
MSLKDSLQNAPITHVDLSYYVETEKGTKVGDVLAKMKASHRKCALVMDRGQLVGIFTERDIMKHVAAKPENQDVFIEDLMTPNPKTIDASTTVVEAARIVGETRYRYMPVVNKQGKVLGTLTYYAILKYISDYFPEEIYNQPPVPDLFATARAGA